MATAKSLLKSNRLLKKQVAQIFNISNKQVQDLVDNLIEHASSDNWQVSPSTCEAWALSHTNSRLYQVLDWDATSEERQAVLQGIFDQIIYIVGKDNKVYKIQEVI